MKGRLKEPKKIITAKDRELEKKEETYGGDSRVVISLSLDSYELMRFANLASRKEIILDKFFDLMMKEVSDNTN